MELEYEFNEDSFSYEPDVRDFKKAMESILKKEAKVKDGECEPIEKLMQLFDDIDLFLNEEFLDCFEEDLTEWFYEQAEEEFNNQNAIKAEEAAEWREYERNRM